MSRSALVQPSCKVIPYRFGLRTDTRKGVPGGVRCQLLSDLILRSEVIPLPVGRGPLIWWREDTAWPVGCSLWVSESEDAALLVDYGLPSHESLSSEDAALPVGQSMARHGERPHCDAFFERVESGSLGVSFQRLRAQFSRSVVLHLLHLYSLPAHLFSTLCLDARQFLLKPPRFLIQTPIL